MAIGIVDKLAIGGGFHDHFLGGFVLVEDSRKTAFAQHQNAVTHGQNFRQFRGSHDDAGSLFHQFSHQGINFGFGAHINTVGGFIQQQHMRFGEQAFCQGHFLLIAAGEFIHQHICGGCFDAKFVDRILNGLIFGFLLDDLIDAGNSQGLPG